MEEKATTGPCHLLDLPWEDVLVPHVLCHLPLQHLVRLQRVSKEFRSLVRVYLANCRTFHLAQVSGGEAFLPGMQPVTYSHVHGSSPHHCGVQVGPCVPREAFCSMLKDNKVLRSLSLQNCSDWLSDKELLPVVEQNQHLERVDMSGCAGLTRHSLAAVSLGCLHLKHLGLAHCQWVDRLSLRSLADHCGGLRSVDLTACRPVKNDTVCYLARKCTELRSLSLAVNANVTDESVEEVAKNCRSLEQLDLTGCLRVSDRSIRTLAEYCPRLRSLKVNHCHNVTESSLDPLRKRNVAIDVGSPLLLQDMLAFAPFINLQI